MGFVVTLVEAYMMGFKFTFMLAAVMLEYLVEAYIMGFVVMFVLVAVMLEYLVEVT